MSENIDYYEIVEFINNDILDKKLELSRFTSGSLSGGMNMNLGMANGFGKDFQVASNYSEYFTKLLTTVGLVVDGNSMTSFISVLIVLGILLFSMYNSSKNDKLPDDYENIPFSQDRYDAYRQVQEDYTQTPPNLKLSTNYYNPYQFNEVGIRNTKPIHLPYPHKHNGGSKIIKKIFDEDFDEYIMNVFLFLFYQFQPVLSRFTESFGLKLYSNNTIINTLLPIIMSNIYPTIRDSEFFKDKKELSFIFILLILIILNCQINLSSIYKIIAFISVIGGLCYSLYQSGIVNPLYETITHYINESSTEPPTVNMSTMVGGSAIMTGLSSLAINIRDIVSSLMTNINNIADILITPIVEIITYILQNTVIPGTDRVIIQTLIKIAGGIGIIAYRQEIIEAMNIIATKLYEFCFGDNTEDKLVKKLKRLNEYKTKFNFNHETGLIMYNGDNSYGDNEIITVICNDTKTTHSILMKTDLRNKEIKFHVNNIILDNSENNISYVDGRPVHMAFIMAYLCNKNLLNKQIESPFNEQTIFDSNNNLQTLDLEGGYKNSTNFKFSMDGGNVVLFELKEQKYKPTITLAIETTDTDKKTEYLEKTCGELFDISGNHNTCSKHFYSIFGKSAIAMMNNFGEVIKTKKDVVNTMLKAHPGILYEILKNLNWKLKINDGLKEMVNVETWLSKLPDNQAKQFGNYLKENLEVKNLLNKIVERINTDPSTLEIKYENFLNSNGHKLRNKKKILNPLRAQALQQQETAKLLMPINYQGMQFFKQLNPYISQSGGTKDGIDFGKKYNELNLRLSKFNQKLDQKTHEAIVGKINVIKELHKQLDDTINNINKYSALVQNKGIPVFERNISEKKINELLKEYEETFAKSVKKIVSVSTAFGKMQYLIEEQELKEAKPFYYTIGNN